MRCPTCDQLSLLHRAADNLDREVVWLMWAINAALTCHLSVMHNLTYRDVPLRPSWVGEWGEAVPEPEARAMDEDP